MPEVPHAAIESITATFDEAPVFGDIAEANEPAQPQEHYLPTTMTDQPARPPKAKTGDQATILAMRARELSINPPL